MTNARRRHHNNLTMNTATLSTFLFARPSFVEGIARVLDMGDTLTEFNQSLHGSQADRIALASDWMAVGCDIRDAIGLTLDDLQFSEPMNG